MLNKISSWAAIFDKKIDLHNVMEVGNEIQIVIETAVKPTDQKLKAFAKAKT